jgi:hypothetical protein
VEFPNPDHRRLDPPWNAFGIDIYPVLASAGVADRKDRVAILKSVSRIRFAAIDFAIMLGYRII